MKWTKKNTEAQIFKNMARGSRVSMIADIVIGNFTVATTLRKNSDEFAERGFSRETVWETTASTPAVFWSLRANRNAAFQSVMQSAKDNLR